MVKCLQNAIIQISREPKLPKKEKPFCLLKHFIGVAKGAYPLKEGTGSNVVKKRKTMDGAKDDNVPGVPLLEAQPLTVLPEVELFLKYADFQFSFPVSKKKGFEIPPGECRF